MKNSARQGHSRANDPRPTTRGRLDAHILALVMLGDLQQLNAELVPDRRWGLHGSEGIFHLSRQLYYLRLTLCFGRHRHSLRILD